MTLEDMEQFRKLSATRQDDIFDHIITIYIFLKTIQSNTLVISLRNKKVDELFSHSLKRDMVKESILEQYEEVRRMISTEIINTFINPEPPVPMDIGIIIEDGENHKKRP